ncbi:DJ-1/PfpI family protein [Mycolicibacterium sp.]|uniref:DJ-1/PfpI family protein n=1 Tax=Mycolicibacterium sp. TaxID=2320850 RepID=UPI003D0FE289
MTAALEFSGRQPSAAMIVFPGLTMLDLVGPWEALRWAFDLHLVGSTTEPFLSDTGLPFRAHESLADAPEYVDMIFVPGGGGTADAMRDRGILDFLADRGERARYVTSVCTGSLVLGAAGLLAGYRATSHWSAVELLPAFGAIPTEGRVVIDRNRITGGGVTAGIDFGLVVMAEMLGEQAARYSQLLLEYDPAPPFDGGSPANASAEAIQKVRDYVAPLFAATQRHTPQAARSGDLT